LEDWRRGIGELVIGGLVVEGGFDGKAAAVEDVGIYHCGFDVFVAEEFLDGADVVAALQKVGGEAMPDGWGSWSRSLPTSVYKCGCIPSACAPNVK